MLNGVVTFQQLNGLEAGEVLDMTKTFCMSGKDIHPESLKALVLRLTYLSRDLRIKQEQRDDAANMATSLANAAIKSYGQHSDYSKGLLHDIQSILNR